MHAPFMHSHLPPSWRSTSTPSLGVNLNPPNGQPLTFLAAFLHPFSWRTTFTPPNGQPSTLLAVHLHPSKRSAFIPYWRSTSTTSWQLISIPPGGQLLPFLALNVHSSWRCSPHAFGAEGSREMGNRRLVVVWVEV